MISDISKGRSFRGCLDYVLGKEEALLLGGNMAGENARDLASEFGGIRTVRADIEVPVFHASLSLAPGEEMTPENMVAAAEKYLRKMGMDPDNHQFVVVQHRDTAHRHFHIVANRIGYDGSYWSDSKDYKKSMDACRELEKEYGLQQVQNYGKQEGQQLSKRDRQDLEEIKAMGLEEHPKQTLARRIEAAVAASDGTREDFARKLQAENVEAKFSYSRAGKIYGVSYRMDDGPEGIAAAYSGKQVGKGYEWKGIEEKLEARALEIETQQTQEKEQAKAQVAEIKEQEREASGREVSMAELRALVNATLARYEGADKQRQREASEGKTLADEIKEQKATRREADTLKREERQLAGEMHVGAARIERRVRDEAFEEGHVVDYRKANMAEGLENDAESMYAAMKAENQAQVAAEASRAAEAGQEQHEAPRASQAQKAGQTAAPAPRPMMQQAAASTSTAREQDSQAAQSTGSGLKLKLERAHGSDDQVKPEVTKNEPVADLDKLKALAKAKMENRAEMSKDYAARARYNDLKEELRKPDDLKREIANCDASRKILEEKKKALESEKLGFGRISNRAEIALKEKALEANEQKMIKLEAELKAADQRIPAVTSEMKELESKHNEAARKALHENKRQNKADLTMQYAACVKEYGREAAEAALAKHMPKDQIENLRRDFDMKQREQARLRAKGKGKVVEVEKDGHGNTVARKTYDRGR